MTLTVRLSFHEQPSRQITDPSDFSLETFRRLRHRASIGQARLKNPELSPDKFLCIGCADGRSSIPRSPKCLREFRGLQIPSPIPAQPDDRTPDLDPPVFRLSPKVHRRGAQLRFWRAFSLRTLSLYSDDHEIELRCGNRLVAKLARPKKVTRP